MWRAEARASCVAYRGPSTVEAARELEDVKTVLLDADSVVVHMVLDKLNVALLHRFGLRATTARIREATTLGSLWKRVETRPTAGAELKNKALKDALQTKQTFSKAEVHRFKLGDALRTDSYIAVGDVFYVQSAKAEDSPGAAGELFYIDEVQVTIVNQQLLLSKIKPGIQDVLAKVSNTTARLLEGVVATARGEFRLFFSDSGVRTLKCGDPHTPDPSRPFHFYVGCVKLKLVNIGNVLGHSTTSKVAHAAQRVGSFFGADFAGKAVQKICAQITTKLAPLIDKAMPFCLGCPTSHDYVLLNGLTVTKVPVWQGTVHYASVAEAVAANKPKLVGKWDKRRVSLLSDRLVWVSGAKALGTVKEFEVHADTEVRATRPHLLLQTPRGHTWEGILFKIDDEKTHAQLLDGLKRNIAYASGT